MTSFVFLIIIPNLNAKSASIITILLSEPIFLKTQKFLDPMDSSMISSQVDDLSLKTLLSIYKDKYKLNNQNREQLALRFLYLFYYI